MTEPEVAPGPWARKLIRAADRAVLATALPDDGWPYGSLAMAACDHGANPLLLLSDLAEHTKNIQADSRASLLYDGTAGLDVPLTGARATVLGRLVECDDEALVARYVARHPDAADYLGFSDFKLYRMAIERAHLVAGFGVIHWLAADDVAFDATAAAALAEHEAGIVKHMNQDHADAVTLYATNLLQRSGEDWAMTGIDPEGCDLRRAGETARLEFETTVHDAAEARAILVRLVDRTRDS